MGNNSDTPGLGSSGKCQGATAISPRNGLLIIANFNQVGEIQNFLYRACQYFPIEHSLVVDDCSTDGSREIAERMGYKTKRHPQNMGIGSAIRTGIEHAIEHGYEWVMISSSNGKIRPEDFETVYAPIVRGEADYVTGSRFLQEGKSDGLPLFRRLTIPLFSLSASLLLGRRFSDITCGFRAYKISFLQNSNIDIGQSWLNRYELEYYIHYWACKNRELRIREVPVNIEYSHLAKGRVSKIRPITGWWSMIRPFIFLTLGFKQ